jgi:hypothetical protein
MDASWDWRRSVAAALACLIALTAAACGTATPSPAAPTATAIGSPGTSGAPATPADTVPPCTLAMLSFALAPWEGAMGTAYGGIVIGLTSGPTTCSLHGAVGVALGGPSAPEIAVDSAALPTNLVLRREALDPAAPQVGEAVIRLTFRNWCPDQPAAGTLRVEIVPVGVSPSLATTFPTPACTTPGGPASLEVGPLSDGGG